MTTAKKVHEDRDLSFPELGALLGARNMIAAGLIEHSELAGPSRYSRMRDGEHLFNMGIACETAGCGSIACIGGTVALIMGKNHSEASDYVQSHDWRHTSLTCSQHPNADRPIAKLYFPDVGRYKNITNAQAVAAIDNFLNTGSPQWSKVFRTVLR